jgi:hypothetical protein
MGLGQSRQAVRPQQSFTLPFTPTTSTSTAQPYGNTFTTLTTVIVGIILIYFAVLFFNYIQGATGQPGISMFEMKSTGDVTPTTVDGKTRTVIPAGDAPSTGGIDYGFQYWMFLSDWNYKFGSNKEVLKRIGINNAMVQNPRIFLSPTDNTLNVQVSIYPTGEAAGAAVPGASTTGDSQTCSVENIPLQTWFSVSVTVFQRNMDIYINGRLVKSCVLNGVPKPSVGNIILNDLGGFSGALCNVNYYNGMLTPDDAKEFHSKGTTCSPPATAGAVTPVDDSVFITLFGYTFRFSTLNKAGEELNSYTF